MFFRNVKQLLWFVMLASVLNPCIFPLQFSIAAPKRALLQEDVSYVNANVYGAGLNATTLNAALSALGTTNKQTLFLATGVWNLASNVTVPLNITLWIPSGTTVTINGGVTFTVNGPLLVDADNVTWHSGAGTFIWNYVSPISVSLGIRSIAQDGAKCDGTTDDTAALNATIAYCITNRCRVFIPPSATYCKVTAPINVLGANGLIIEGVSRRFSHLYCTQADDCLRLGDGTSPNQSRDVILRNFEIFSSNVAALWTLKLLIAYNAIIEQMQIVNPSTQPTFGLSGGIYVNNSADVTIRENVIAPIQGGSSGILATNASNNLNILANRIDGVANPTSGTGMSIITRGGVIQGNAAQSLQVGYNLTAGTGFLFAGNYCEVCRTGILNDATYLEGGSIIGNFFDTNGTTTYPIDIKFGKNLTIANNHFFGHPLNQVNGRYVAINANYETNNDWVIGPNSLHDTLGTPPFVDQEILLHSSYGSKNMDVVSAHAFYSGTNILQGTFEAWPTTTTGPGPWRLSIAAPRRATDSPFGRYGADFDDHSAAGLLVIPFPVISTTYNAELRGQYAMFCIYLKTVSGVGGNLRVQIVDGINTYVGNVIPTATFARSCHGVTISATATIFEILLDNNTTGIGTIRVASPGLWLGTTLPQLPVTNPSWLYASGPLAIDGTTHASTGAGDQQLVVTTVPKFLLGNSSTIKVKAVGTIAGVNDTKTVSLIYGGSTLATISEMAGDTADWSIEAEILNINDSTQRINVTTKAGTAFKAFDYLTTSVANFANDKDLEIRANPTNAGDTVSVTYFRVDLAF